MMEYDRARLKAAARQALKYQRPHPMLITLLFIIIVNIGSRLVDTILGAASGSSSLYTMYAQALLEYGEPEYAIQYVLLSFSPQRLTLALFVGVFIAGIITSLWTGLMRTGYNSFCLEMVRGRQPQSGELFRVFPQWAGVLITQFLAGLFRTLWALLLGVGATVLVIVDILLFSDALPALAVILFLVIYIAFFAGLVLVTLRYAMVDFLIADQGRTGLDAIRESKRLMQGSTGRLFMLKLSFIGWYLMEAGIIITCAMPLFLFLARMGAYGSSAAVGIPTDAFGVLIGMGLSVVAFIAIAIFNLWLTPYATGAEALFYDWLRGVDSTPSGGYGYGPAGGWGQPQPPQQNGRYTWNPTPGSSSGKGIGSGPQGGGTPPQPPKPPKSPKDDPWD